MKDFNKNLIKTSLTLMIIAGGSTVLIGAVNAITAPVIADNTAKKENKSLAVVFDDTDVSDTYASRTLDSAVAAKLKYVQKVWDVYTDKSKSTFVGTIARCAGTNQYGSVDFLIGFKGSDYQLSKLVMISDTMSYKGKLEPGYVDPYNAATDGADKEAALENVKCGATFAATLIHDCVNEAKKIAKNEIKGDLDASAKLFGTEETYTEVTDTLLKKAGIYVKEAWQCKDGYVLRATGSADSISEEIWVAITNDGVLSKVAIVSDGYTGSDTITPKTYVDAINAASDKNAAYDDSKNYTSTGDASKVNVLVHDMIQEALNYVKPAMPAEAKLFGDSETYEDQDVPSTAKYVKQIWKCSKGIVVYSSYTDESGEEGFTESIYTAVNSNGTLYKVYLAEDGNTIGSDLKPYIDAINNAGDKDAAYQDSSNFVSGATHSSYFIQQMIKEAISLGTPALPEKAQMFGSDATYTYVSTLPTGMKYMKNLWKSTDGYVAYSTYTDESGEEDFTESIYTAVNNDGTLKQVYLAEDGNTIGSDLNPYVDKINNATDKDAAYQSSDNFVSGATHSSYFIQQMIKEAITGVKSLTSSTASSLKDSSFSSNIEAKLPTLTYSFASERR